MAIYTIENGYKGKRSFKRPILALAAFLILGAGSYFISDFRSAPETMASSSPSAPKATIEAKPSLELTQPIQWPTYGQSAYGVDGEGVLATNQNKVAPTASLAKIITALAIMKQKPLKPGEQGPSITITQSDIRIYEEYVRKDGSVVPVELGEQITQYQALQAMLLSSANNISDALVIWAFGSQDNYVTYANKMLVDMKLSNTHVADASGFSPNTTSTAHDLALLGLHYVQDPVLKEIAQQPEATIPFAGVIKNYNSLVNKDGILGIKVGNTDEAGRCFVVVDMRAGKPVSSVAIQGAPSLQVAMTDALTILKTGESAYDSAVATRP